MRNTVEPQVRNDTIRDVTRDARTALGSILGLAEILTEDLVESHPRVLSDLEKICAASRKVESLLAYLEEQVDSEREQASRDPLTGVANRRTLVARGEALFVSETPLSVLLIDVDKFKDVNDRYGHLTGDDVLKILVERCKRAVRDSDLVARFAGDEFVILLPNTPILDAEIVAGRVLANIVNTPFATREADVPLTVSVGVATRQDVDTSMEALMARADRAMYDAKQQGGARISRL